MGNYVPTPKPPVGREFVQVHTRKLDRAVAHARMERAGLQKVNKHDYTNYRTMTGMIVQQRIDSYFSTHWREVASEEMINM